MNDPHPSDPLQPRVRGPVSHGAARSPLTATQQLILDAAERLFARHGVAATSLRSITGEAGVNTAAIHYHFGSKPALVRAILHRRFSPLNEERARLLDALEADAGVGPIPADALLRAFLGPMVSEPSAIGDSMRQVHALFAWLHGEGERDRVAIEPHFVEIKGRFAEALARGRRLGLEEANERIGYAMGAMVQLMSHASGLVEPAPASAAEFERRVERLYQFLAPALDAPAYDAPSAPAESPQAQLQEGVQA